MEFFLIRNEGLVIEGIILTPKPSETNMGLRGIKIKVTWLGIIPNGLFLVFDCFGH